MVACNSVNGAVTALVNVWFIVYKGVAMTAKRTPEQREHMSKIMKARHARLKEAERVDDRVEPAPPVPTMPTLAEAQERFIVLVLKKYLHAFLFTLEKGGRP